MYELLYSLDFDGGLVTFNRQPNSSPSPQSTDAAGAEMPLAELVKFITITTVQFHFIY
jgi:hypothetical protein